MIRQLESKSFLFFFRDHLRSRIISGPFWGSFAVGDHLRYCTFPHVSLHKDLQHSTDCMQIILKSRFQFLHWVMKNVLFSKVITIFKLIYLFWVKMVQTLPRFGVTRFTSASACFLSPFPGSCATWLRRSLNSKTLSTPRNGKSNRGRPR